MKPLVCILSVSMIFIMSCSASKNNFNKDLQGSWVSRSDQPVYPGAVQPRYYQFTFKNDSFYVEIGVLSDDIDISYEPFRSKGHFKISDSYLTLTGVAKAEGSKNFNLDYTETFTYDYSTNYLTLYSMNRYVLGFYDLTRKSPVIK